MKNLVTINDSMLRSLTCDQRFLAAFPCLQQGKKGLQAAPSQCGRCRNKRKAAQAAALQGLRQCLAGLDAASKRELKRLLNTKQVRIVYRNGAGKTIQLTF